jgi:nitronate monooxygenase
MTRSISGRPARGFANRLTALGTAPACPALPDYPIVYDAGKALHAAAKAKGSADFAAQWAGQGFRLSRALPAAELMRKLGAEMAA